jgi:hypothetical protein
MEKLKSGVWIRGVTEPVTFTPGKLREAMAECDRLLALLDQARPADPLVKAEYRMAAGLWKHGCKRLLISAGEAGETNDPALRGGAMAAELRALQSDFAACWLARNRPGGLGDSMARMARLLAEYDAM